MPLTAFNLTLSNLALAQIGEQRLVGLQQDGATARVCREMVDMIRQQFLAAHAWNFATTLAKLVTPGPTPAFKFTRSYDLPAGFLRLWEVDGEEAAAHDDHALMALGSPAALRLLCDIEEPEIEYSFDTEIPAGAALRACSLLLADAIAPTIKAEMAGKFLPLYEREMAMATRIDAAQSPGKRRAITRTSKLAIGRRTSAR